MKICTHSGPFHCDDVFAVAVLLKLYPDAEVVRTRDESLMDECDIVLDVGKIYDHEKKRYDHHQLGRAGERENGIFHSALGLIWRHYGLEWCEGNEELHVYIDERLVQFVDADDNGQEVFSLNELKVAPVTLPNIVKWYRPQYGEEQNFDARFMEIVAVATEILEKLRTRGLGNLKADAKVREIYTNGADKRVIVMDEFIPLGKLPDDAPELLIHAYPDPNGHWAMKVVPKSPDSFEARKSLPKSWAGLTYQELADLTGVEDATFCHNARFVAGAKSKEGILKLLELALAEPETV